MTYPVWDESHARRVRAMITVEGAMVVLIGGGWSTWALAMERPALATCYALLVLTGFVLLALVHRQRLRTATLVAVHTVPLLATLVCLFDNPGPDVPRSAHMFHLALAAGSYFVFRRDGVYLRMVLPGLFLVLFVAFTLTPLKLTDPAIIIPPYAQWTGAWINTVMAVIAFVIAVMLMHADLSERNDMEEELRRAIAHSAFVLHYQPQVDSDGRVIGAEALLRWRHSTRGEVGPATFIPVAEETGLIVPIGAWVLRAACAQLALWNSRPETAHLTLSVNISASQFLQPDFLRTTIETVRSSGARPSQLVLELTESMVVEDMAGTAARMQVLRELGIVWSLDDLGTGYSSLKALSGLPFGQIKIDQSFVSAMAEGGRDMHIVEAVAALSRRLSIALIAEGVETQEQFSALLRGGCQAFQGYLFGAPMGLRDFEAHMSRAGFAKTAPQG